MQFKFLRIPTDDPGPATDELNGFLRSHRVVTVRSELVCLADAAFWAVSVEYLEGAPKAPERPVGKVDYREVLDEATFRVFSRLRDWRKAEAEKERVPVYTLFTNEQLAEMARRRVQNLADLGQIEGVGEARVSKYGAALLQVMAAVATDGPAPDKPALQP